MYETIFDQLPQPGSGLERAYRAMALEDQRIDQAEKERQEAAAAHQQEHEDQIAFMELTGRHVPTTAEWLATVAALSDMEDARQERARGDGHSRADRLEERANILRAQRNELRQYEDTRLAVERARVKAEAAVRARDKAEAAERGRRYSRGNSYR